MHIDDAINHEKRITVRQRLEDRCDVSRLEHGGGLLH